MDINKIMIITGIITALVALYGAGLSTYIFFTQRKDEKPDVKIKLSNGVLTYTNGRLSEAMLFISASNNGKRTVILRSFGLVLPGDKTMVFPDAEGEKKLPYELKSEDDCQFWVGLKEVAEGLSRSGFLGKIKIKGFFRDAVDRTYISKPMKFKIKEWLKR